MESADSEPDWDGPEGVEAVETTSTSYVAVQVPAAGVKDDTRLLCVLHGWGQRAASFLRRFSALRDENILFVAIQAPHQFYLDMGSRKVGFSWLTVYDRKRAMADIYGQIDRALEYVGETHGITTPPIMLGFSQGVSIAYRYHLLGKRAVRGVIACGGDLPKDVRPRLVGSVDLDILLVHGKSDGIVSFSKAEEAEALLKTAGLAPDTCYFEGEHEIPAPAIESIGKWVLSRP